MGKESPGMGGDRRRAATTWHEENLVGVLTLRPVTRIKGHEWCSLIGPFWFCSWDRSNERCTRLLCLCYALHKINPAWVYVVCYCNQIFVTTTVFMGSSREGTTVAGHGSQQRIDAQCRQCRVERLALDSIGPKPLGYLLHNVELLIASTLYIYSTRETKASRNVYAS